jgi:putative PIN family toxin of toxin-antitoxin system
VTPAIIDTNVVVAGLLTTDATSPPGRILDAMLAGRFPYLLSEALLGEYRAVLLRTPIQRRHGLDEAEIERLLTALVTNGIVRDPPLRGGAPDADDAHLWALALDDIEAVLVTGDAALLAAQHAKVKTASPREFRESLQASAGR